MTTKKFYYYGRRWTIRLENGVWYFNAMVDGKRYHCSLHQTDVSGAIEMARVKIDSIYQDRKGQDNGSNLKAGCWATYVDSFEERAAAYVKPVHVNHYRNIMVKVLSDILGPGFHGVRTEFPSVNQIETWKANVVKSRSENDAEVARAKRYVNDMLRQLSTFVGPRWQSRLGVSLGEGSRNIIQAGRFGRVPRPVFRPSKELIQKTMDLAASELWKVDADAYKIFWFAVGTGARRGEIIKVRWEHFQRDTKPVRVVADFLTKDGDQAWLQFVYPLAWEKLKEVAPPEWEGSIIRTTGRNNGRCAFDKLCAWMAQIGWTGKFKVHELRAAVVTKVYESHGIAHAQAVARHKNASTTDKYIRRRSAKLPEIEF